MEPGTVTMLPIGRGAFVLDMVKLVGWYGRRDGRWPLQYCQCRVTRTMVLVMCGRKARLDLVLMDFDIVSVPQHDGLSALRPLRFEYTWTD